MRLPEDLAEAMEREFEKVQHPALAQAVSQLTARYQGEDFSGPIVVSAALRAAYLAVRLPATYAAAARVLEEMKRYIREEEVGSVLDLGSGPGTVLHAAAWNFSSLRQMTAVESDTALIELGRRLASQSFHECVQKAAWLCRDLKSGAVKGRHDLVVMSYVLGELPAAMAEKALAGAWEAAGEFLVLIEPGTRRGFGAIHAARSALIGAGAHVLAPCPHTRDCPMAAANDWCHFPVRVERTSLHRRLKGGVLGYEDEKFSYLIATRRGITPAPARIVRHPQKHSGHIRLTLCTPEGIEQRTVTKSQKEQYKAARKADWGEEF